MEKQVTTTLIATGIIGGLLLVWVYRRYSRRRNQTRIANLARLGVELAIAERTGDIATADQIRTEMKARGVVSIEIIDVNEQDNQ